MASKYMKHGLAPMPHVDPKFKWTAKLLGATMWFWIFYRINKEGPVMFGFKKPFEHHH